MVFQGLWEKVINNVGKNGEKWYKVGNFVLFLHSTNRGLFMITFIGDYTCKLDDKGRVLLPAAFIKQMAHGMQERFVLKKDIFEKCLVLYPMDEWERQNQILRSNTNPYNREHNKFLRGYFKDTAEVSLDANNRLLLPRRLMDDIGADKEIVLAGQLGKIEIWPRNTYDAIESGSDDFAALAEKIMGNISKDKNE
jgi:MraZ protein